MTGRYTYFSGTKSKGIDLSTDQEVQLEYKCKVSKGSLNLSIISPSGVAEWQQEFTEDASDTLTFKALEAGQHKVVLMATDAGGSFDVKWSTKR